MEVLVDLHGKIWTSMEVRHIVDVGCEGKLRCGVGHRLVMFERFAFILSLGYPLTSRQSKLVLQVVKLKNSNATSNSI